MTVGSLNTSSGGNYTFDLAINNTGDNDISNNTLSETVDLQVGITLITGSNTVCVGSTNSTLSASYPAGTIDNGYAWFGIETLSPVVGRNASVNVPFVTNDTIFKVTDVISEGYVGMVDINVGNGFVTESNQFNEPILFDVEQPITLDSVTIYPENANYVTIRVTEGSNVTGSVFFEKTLLVTAAQAGKALRVPLNIFLDKGEYNINLSQTSSTFQKLRRHISGSDYSNGIPNVISLRSGSSTSEYNYFYNWKVTVLGCDIQTVAVWASEPIISNIQAQDISCFGANDGSVNILLDNGFAPYTFNWSSNATTQNLDNLSAGSYQVTFTDAAGCVGMSDSAIIIVEPQEIIVTSQIQPISCFGETDAAINLTVQGGASSTYSFQWSNNATSQNLNNLGDGLYELTVTDVNGCTDTSSYDIVEPGILTISDFSTTLESASLGLGSATPIIEGGTAPFSYQWDAGANYQTTATANNLQNGFYLLSIIDAGGCVFTDTAFIFTVSDENISLAKTFKVYPNPAAHFVNLELTLNSFSDVNIELLDIQGRLIQSWIRKNTTVINEQLDLNELPEGVYLLRFTLDDGVITKRLLIKN